MPDDAIGAVAADLRLYSGQALVHTSGLLASTILEPAMAAGTEKASFHPLVAFADPDAAVEALHGATIAIEGDDPLVRLLAELAEAIGAQPVRLPVEGKAAYHAPRSRCRRLRGAARRHRRARSRRRPRRGGRAGHLRAARPPSLGQRRAPRHRGRAHGPIVRGDIGTLRAHLLAMSELAPGAIDLYVAVARREIALASARGSLASARADEMVELLDRWGAAGPVRAA